VAVADLAIERITARYDQLTRQDDRGFVLHMGTYLKTVDGEPRAKKIVEHLRAEADAAADAFAAIDRQLVAELVEVRTRLEADAPEIGLANDPPEPEDPLARRTWLMETLSGFDRVASTEREVGFAPLPYYSTGNPGRAQSLLQILRGLLFRAQYGAAFGGVVPQDKVRTDLDDYEIEISNAQESYLAEKQKFKIQEQTLPGLADERLHLFVEALTPEPLLRQPGEDEFDFMDRTIPYVLGEMGDRGILRRATSGQQLDRRDEESFKRVVSFLRDEVDRLHVEVIDRLRTEQSATRASLVDRGKRLSLKALALYLTALVALAAGASFAYAKHWFSHSGHGKPAITQPHSSPTKPVTTTTGG
jgi:hypothetical protein